MKSVGVRHNAIVWIIVRVTCIHVSIILIVF